jgi:hypothetical protein
VRQSQIIPALHLIQRVTSRRIKYLTAAFRELVLDRPAARQRAILVYSSYFGHLKLQTQGLVPDRDEPAFNEYVEHVIETPVDRAGET